MTNRDYNKEFNVTPAQVKRELDQIRQEKKADILIEKAQ